MPPLAHGSPEEDHILSHGDYLAPHRLRFAGLAALNLVAFGMLFVWVAWFLATWALIAEVAVAKAHAAWLTDLMTWVGQLPWWLPMASMFIGLYLVIRGLYSDGGFARYLLPLGGAVLLVAASPATFAWLTAHPDWWSLWSVVRVVALLVAITAIVTGVSYVAQNAGVSGKVAVWLNRITVWIPRALGFVLLASTAQAWYGALLPAMASDDVNPLVVLAFGATLLGTLAFSHIPHRASLHREYRNRLASCFAVLREGDQAVIAGDMPLTKLQPNANRDLRFPRLLVCATANVHVSTSRDGARPFVPYVFSHDVCGVPRYPGSGIPTAKLELLQEPAGLTTWQTESSVSLMTAVAATGAAVSPSMGRMTLPSGRMLLAALNIRLGRWVPNPFSARSRRRVEAMRVPGRFDRDERMGPGYNELIPEMLGLDGPRMYVSDGGHYDNLGLLALLEARCATIWCVDASPEPLGLAAELRRVFAVARDGIIIGSEINLDRFHPNPAGLYGSTHAIGSLQYGDGKKVDLVVIKLGLSAQSPADLRDRQMTDLGFPHHSTFFNQVYSRDRMDAYRRLGYDSARSAIIAMSA